MSRNLLATVVGGIMLLTGPAFGGEWHVKADAPEGGDGSSAAPFRTIQQAVDAAAADDTVYVRPGVYDRGSTNAWSVSHNNISFQQQTRVYVTKRLNIVSTGGKGVTTIRGSHGTTSTSGTSIAFRIDGVQGLVIGADAEGTVVRGFTIENGNAHQSAAPGSVAAGGICSATPGSGNRFLVTDCSFVY